MRKLRGVTIDNGGSEGRVLPLRASIQDGLISYANDFYAIQEKDFRVKDVDDIEKLCRVLEAPKEEYKGIIAQGMTGKAYDNQALAISSQETKTGSVNYYRQFIFAVAQDALAAYKQDTNYTELVNGVFKNLQKLHDFCYSYAIVTCIPIKEYNSVKDCADLLKENLVGEYKVEFPLMPGCPKISFELIKNYIGVVPEGGVAVTGLRRELDVDTITLVVDIGHNTTDIALFKGAALLGKVISSQFAGSTLLANVRAALADEGYTLNEYQMMKALETNTVRRGKDVINVLDIINEQKKSFVLNYLKPEIIQAFNMNALNAKQVQNVIPIGAPMNESGSNIMQNEVIRSCGLEYAEVKLLGNDLRYVNVEQAANFTRRLYDKMSQEVLAVAM